MVVKVAYGKLLIFLEKVGSHMLLHSDAHNVAVIADDVGAKSLDNVYTQENCRENNQHRRSVSENVVVDYVFSNSRIKKIAGGNNGNDL